MDHMLVEELGQMAMLAESFTEQRPRSNKNWQDLADSLDQEGVALWNLSGTVHHEKEPDSDGRTLSAALKYTGYRLIEAGLESKPGLQTLLHMLQLASKVGSALSETGKRDTAARVLMSAAKYEELLRSADDQECEHTQGAAQATMIYYASRMEAVGT